MAEHLRERNSRYGRSDLNDKTAESFFTEIEKYINDKNLRRFEKGQAVYKYRDGDIRAQIVLFDKNTLRRYFDKISKKNNKPDLNHFKSDNTEIGKIFAWICDYIDSRHLRKTAKEVKDGRSSPWQKSCDELREELDIFDNFVLKQMLDIAKNYSETWNYNNAKNRSDYEEPINMAEQYKRDNGLDISTQDMTQINRLEQMKSDEERRKTEFNAIKGSLSAKNSSNFNRLLELVRTVQEKDEFNAVWDQYKADWKSSMMEEFPYLADANKNGAAKGQYEGEKKVIERAKNVVSQERRDSVDNMEAIRHEIKEMSAASGELIRRDILIKAVEAVGNAPEYQHYAVEHGADASMMMRFGSSKDGYNGTIDKWNESVINCSREMNEITRDNCSVDEAFMETFIADLNSVKYRIENMPGFQNLVDFAVATRDEIKGKRSRDMEVRFVKYIWVGLIYDGGSGKETILNMSAKNEGTELYVVVPHKNKVNQNQMVRLGRINVNGSDVECQPDSAALKQCVSWQPVYLAHEVSKVKKSVVMNKIERNRNYRDAHDYYKNASKFYDGGDLEKALKNINIAYSIEMKDKEATNDSEISKLKKKIIEKCQSKANEAYRAAVSEESSLHFEDALENLEEAISIAEYSGIDSRAFFDLRKRLLRKNEEEMTRKRNEEIKEAEAKNKQQNSNESSQKRDTPNGNFF